MKKKLFHVFLSLVFVVSFAFVAFLSKEAKAIPTLARKYKTTCMTCHAMWPRLTALGEAIRLNGYKMPEGDEIYIKEEVLSQGAEAYKRVFPEAVWPSTIPGPPPISLRVLGDADVDISNDRGNKDNRTKLEFPHEAEILSLGAFGDNMSFHLEIGFEQEIEEEGGETKKPIETEFHGWLMWEDIFVDNYLNLRLGSVGAHEIGPPNIRDSNRFAKEHYFYRDEITRDLTGPGVEINGFGRTWRYAAGYAKPQGEFGDGNQYIQGALKFGGLGFDGTGGLQTEGGGIKVPPSGYWRDDAFLLGGFFYRGDDGNDRFGIDGRWTFKDFAVGAGYVVEDADAASSDQTVWFAEAEYWAFPWMLPFVRYESLSDDRSNSDKARVLFGAAFLVRANIKVNLEGSLFTENEPTEAAGEGSDADNRVFGRLDFAW